MTTGRDPRTYHDGYEERIETTIQIQDEGRSCPGEERPKKPVAKTVMEVLRATRNL